MVDKSKPYIEFYNTDWDDESESSNFSDFKDLFEKIRAFNKSLASGAHCFISRSFNKADGTVEKYQELIQDEDGTFYSVGGVFNFDLVPYIEDLKVFED